MIKRIISVSGTSFSEQYEIKSESPDSLMIFSNIATFTEYQKVFVSVTRKANLGQDYVLANSIPLHMFAMLSNYQGGFDAVADGSGTKDAIRIPLGQHVLTGDDSMIVELKTGSTALTASQNFKVFMCDNSAGMEQLIKYDYIPGATGDTRKIANATVGYLYSTGEESSENEIEVKDSFGAKVINSLGVVLQGAVAGKSESWNDFGEFWQNKFGLPDTVEFETVTGQSFLVQSEVYQPERIERNQKPEADYSDMVRIVKSDRSRAKVLRAQGRIA